MAIKVTVRGKAIAGALAKLQSIARNPIAITRALGITFAAITVGNFNPANARFRPIRWRAKCDGTPSNLVRTTRLSRSFILRVQPKSFTLGNPTIYAAIHQFGGIIRPVRAKALVFRCAHGRLIFAQRVKMPARPYVPVTPDGQLTPAASQTLIRAGERALAAQWRR